MSACPGLSEYLRFVSLLREAWSHLLGAQGAAPLGAQAETRLLLDHLSALIQRTEVNHLEREGTLPLQRHLERVSEIRAHLEDTLREFPEGPEVRRLLDDVRALECRLQEEVAG